MEVPGLLKFGSNEQLQNVIDELKNENEVDLRSKKILKKLGLESESPTMLRAIHEPFVSIYDVNYENDLMALTPSDWAVINSDPDEPVYVPEDQLIEDPYFASVLNSNYEVQVENKVYKYTKVGVYVVDVIDYDLLSTINANDPSAPINTNKVLIYKPYLYDDLAEGGGGGGTGTGSGGTGGTDTGTGSGLPQIMGPESLKLADGVAIPKSNIRDINYESTDANWAHRLINIVFGKASIAINNFSSGRKMLTDFYEEDYHVYKKIGVSVKMQKRLFGIWWNIKSQDMRVGWYNIELSEKFSTPNPFAAIPKPVDMTPYLYQNLQIFEPHPLPGWLKKTFPYAAPDEHVIFAVPHSDYVVTFNALANAAFSQGLKAADKMVKAYMKAYNLANTPKNMGLYSFENASTIRFMIGPDEEKYLNKSSTDKKFLSEWLGGSFEIGYATDPNNPNFKFSNFTFNISANPTKLERGIVYGAVKYNNEWRAARIVKNK